MDNSSNLNIVIKAQDQASAELAKVGQSVGGLGGKMNDLGGLAAKLAGPAMLGAVVFAAKSCIDAFNESDAVAAQMSSVLKSTGDISGVTKEQMLQLATSLQSQSKFTDEAIASGENLLLTFTNIRGPIVTSATKAIVDMSTAMGTDLNSAAIQVGKALNDPINGISALQRVGVTFNDTQKETIKKLVESGKTMEAQKMILAELTTEFGGSASAQAQTFAGKIEILKNQFNDAMESVGEFIEQALGPLVDWVMSSMASIGGLGNVVKAFGIGMAAAAQSLVIIFKNTMNKVEEWINDFAAMGSGAINQIIDAFNMLGGHMEHVDFSIKFKGFDASMDIATLDELNTEAMNLGKTIDVTGKKVSDFKIPTAAASGAAKKLGDDLKSLSKTYSDLTDSATTELQKLKDSHASASASIQESINAQLQKMTDLTASYNQAQTDRTNTVAQAVIASQQTIADTQKKLTEDVASIQTKAAADEFAQKVQLATNVDNATRAQIANQIGLIQNQAALAIKTAQDEANKKIAIEQQGLQASQSFIQTHLTQIDQAKKVAAQSDLERALNDYNTKQLKAQEELAQQYDAIAQELEHLKKKNTDEQALYDDKVKAINKIQEQANKDFKKFMENQTQITSDNVKTQIEYFNQLAKAVSAAASGSTTQIKNLAIPQTKIPHMAEGGIVSSPTVALIGEAGPEAVVPLGKMGGQNVTININNPVVRNDADLAIIKQQVEQVLRPLFLNSKPIYT